MEISIHALREEGDKYFLGQSQQAQDFYPRPPRGGRPACVFFQQFLDLFLSTPSARRATEQAFGYQEAWAISIHALREEGDADNARGADCARISIHALREEGDLILLWITC